MGLFEEFIARAISTPSQESTPLKDQQQHSEGSNPKAPNPNMPKGALMNRQNIQPGAATASIIADSQAAQANSAEVIAKISGKFAGKSSDDNSNTGGNSQSPNGAPMVPVSSLEILAEQLFAMAVPTVNVPDKLSVQPGNPKASFSSAQITVKAGMVLPTLSQTENTKNLASDDLESQTTPTASAASGQKLNLISANEVLPQEENSGLAIKADTAATVSSNDKLAFEPENDSSRETAPGISTAAQVQSDSNGTSIAKQDMPMKQAEKMNKFAGQTEKVLPGNAVSMAKASSPVVSPANAVQSVAAAMDNSSNANNSGTVSTLPADSVVGPTANDLRARVLERTQDLITVNATRLSDSGNNSMQVVIKPDAGTQLSLELRQQGGHVEVQAVLQQGDFNHLSQQWSDLQQRLDQRGIRLAPLTDNASAFTNSSNDQSYQNNQSQTTEGIPQMSLVDASAGITPAAVFTPESTQASAHRGWETWA
jgi:hypothetical protein